jgi:hypothetical protein
MAVYSSSINFVSAKGEVKAGNSIICSKGPSGNNAVCEVTNGSDIRTYVCKYDVAAEKWSCEKWVGKTGSGSPNGMTGSETLGKMTDSQIPLGLKSALDSAVKAQSGGPVTGQGSTVSPTPPQCPNTGPIPPDCTMKPPLK